MGSAAAADRGPRTADRATLAQLQAQLLNTRLHQPQEMQQMKQQEHVREQFWQQRYVQMHAQAAWNVTSPAELQQQYRNELFKQFAELD